MPDSPVLKKSQGNNCMIAERLSARLLIVQCSQLTFVCMYLYIPVTLELLGRGFCGLVPRMLATWYRSDQEVIERSCTCESRNGRWSDLEAIDV